MDRPSKIDSLLPAQGTSARQSPTIVLILDRMAASAPAASDRGSSQKKEKSEEKGGGTPLAEYMGPESGPFCCGRCEYFEGGKFCVQKVVLKDPEIDKDGGRAVVDAKGCCRFFEPS
jgi:hypothetical protein